MAPAVGGYMPKVVESFPKSSKRLIPYEWDKWFDGQIWAFVEGVDYFNEKHSDQH